MANEYLKRQPTSTGNRKVFTWSGWVKTTKESKSGNGNDVFFCASSNDTGSTVYHRTRIGKYVQTEHDFGFNHYDGANDNYASGADFRDFSSWSHYLCAVDTTKEQTNDRVKIYVNGARISDLETVTAINQNLNTFMNGLTVHYVGADGWTATPNTMAKLFMFDAFLVDGQALTPDVFGFYKDGDGYMSSGTSIATDFKPGQWMPHSPRKIKSDVERRGGFGVNGYYLPMNGSNNPGADFHCTPNTILKLKEDQPQPKAEIDGGANYAGSLRNDPFKDYLVLAVPGVLGGKQNGYGDYSADIKGSGSNKIFTANGNATVSATASYYGSAMTFDGTGDHFRTTSNLSDFHFGTGDFTVEAWIFKSAQGSYNYDGVISLGGQGSANDGWFIEASNTRGYLWYASGSGNHALQHNVPVNTSQWNHICVERHNGRTTMYLNGVAVDTTASTYSIPTNGTFLDIGGYGLDGLAGTGEYYFNGKIQDVRVYKGVAKYKGGFDINKPYTPINFVDESWRTTADTCKNNFATLNSLDTNQITPFNGNLSVDQSSGGWYTLLGTHYVRSGKWYAEMRIDRLGWIFFGVDQTYLETRTRHVGGQSGSKGVGLVYNTGNRGDITYNGGNSAYTGADATAATGDIISIALDLDSKSVKFYKNNILQYDLSNILESEADYAFGVSLYSNIAATVNFGQNPSFSGGTTAGTNADDSGKGLFKYAPPSGYLALCDDNLPTPAIADPGEHFKCVLWNGDGQQGRGIRGVGFQPDFVWIKKRAGGTNRDSVLFDTVRGATNQLKSSQTQAESSQGDELISFDDDGFSVGSGDNPNGNGNNYVAWCWKAGGPTVTNTDGALTSQVSVNRTAGFSIVKFTAQGGSNSATVGHGLGKKPAFWIYKPHTNSTAWYVYHQSLGSSAWMVFSSAAAVTSNTAAWGTDPTDKVLTHGAGLVNQGSCILYAWAEIEGYSKFGNYIGNANADGTFVYCGFKPALVITKRTDGTSSWLIHDSSRDPVNPVMGNLYVQSSDAEGRGSVRVDFLSNGFKHKNADGGAANNYANDYIFMAWAESPFQTANAK